MDAVEEDISGEKIENVEKDFRVLLLHEEQNKKPIQTLSTIYNHADVKSCSNRMTDIWKLKLSEYYIFYEKNNLLRIII